MSAQSLFIAGILIILIAVSALFSAIETALFSLQPFQVRRLREKNPRLSSSLEKLMENPRRVLSAILFCDALANVPLIVLCVFLMRDIFPAYIPFWLDAPVIFALVVFACDLIPKMIALTHPYRIAQVGVAVLSVTTPVVEPFCQLLENASEKIANILTPGKFQPHHFLDEDELQTLVQLSAEEGALHGVESTMIRDIIKLGDKTVKDCMMPRIDMFALPDDLPNEEAIQRIKAARHRRVPVYAETPDDILGILDAVIFLADPAKHYTEVLDAPSFVPETMKALDLLRSFFTHAQRMAVIVDEFGGTEGIVTRSDVVEEILSDAVPAADRELYIEHFGDGRLIVNGSVRLDDLSDYLGVHLEEEGVDTLSGLIFNHLGYLPKPGTEIELDGVLCTVRRTARKRIAEVLIKREKKPEPVAT